MWAESVWLWMGFMFGACEHGNECKIWGPHGGDYEECRLLGYKNRVRTSQETHQFSATKSSQLRGCHDIPHGNEFSGCINFLGSWATFSLYRNILQLILDHSSARIIYDDSIALLFIISLIIVIYAYAISWRFSNSDYIDVASNVTSVSEWWIGRVVEGSYLACVEPMKTLDSRFTGRNLHPGPLVLEASVPPTGREFSV
jgi:hypothetical protein